jgi:hypothetical protein
MLAHIINVYSPIASLPKVLVALLPRPLDMDDLEPQERQKTLGRVLQRLASSPIQSHLPSWFGFNEHEGQFILPPGHTKLMSLGDLHPVHFASLCSDATHRNFYLLCCFVDNKHPVRRHLLYFTPQAGRFTSPEILPEMLPDPQSNVDAWMAKVYAALRSSAPAPALKHFAVWFLWWYAV